jgi:hypothetical protein
MKRYERGISQAWAIAHAQREYALDAIDDRHMRVIPRDS